MASEITIQGLEELIRVSPHLRNKICQRILSEQWKVKTYYQGQTLYLYYHELPQDIREFLKCIEIPYDEPLVVTTPGGDSVVSPVPDGYNPYFPDFDVFGVNWLTLSLCGSAALGIWYIYKRKSKKQ